MSNGQYREENAAMEQKRWSVAKEILFTYLAITKIWSWYMKAINLDFSEPNQAFYSLLDRILGLELMLIIGVIFFVFLEKKIFENHSAHKSFLHHVLFYVIGFMMITGINFLYLFLLHVIFESGTISFSEFVQNFFSAMGWVAIGFIVVMVAFNVKSYFKAKEAESTYAIEAKAHADKVEMLNILFADGILSEEEFTQKKEMLGVSD